VVAALNNDPLIAHEVQPTLTVAEMVRADERLKKESERGKEAVMADITGWITKRLPVA
jgi:hypothetical protein